MYDMIPPADSAQGYFDVALRRGRIAASRVKKITNPVTRTKAKERDRMRAVQDSLIKSLKHIHDGYPSFDRLGEFTLNVFKMDMDPGKVKNALGGVNASLDVIRKVTQEHVAMVGKVIDIPNVKKVSKAYLGRMQSILKQIDKHLTMLNKARAVFRTLPTVDESLFTVAIAGFPNVGKSTLLKKMTSANPDVQAYAFTTKGLNIGYFTHMYNKIQCVDTPGTLNREKMNTVEKKAEIALKYLANCIVYVFDPTESYPMKQQEALLKEIVKLDKPLLIYVSKTDMVETDVEGHTDATTLKKDIIAEFKAWI